MCPLARELQKHGDAIQTVICVTGQHRHMLDQTLAVFGVTPDYDLDVLRPEQSLFDVTGGVLEKLPPVLEREAPDAVLVHGDTATAFAAALACYYKGVPVGHVEAGLRTYDPQSPYPEEFNRRAADIISRWHFAPTEACRENLLREGIAPERIFVTGNTVIDALKTTVRADYTHPALTWAAGSRLILLTAHRRESIGPPMTAMFRAVRRLTEDFPDVKVLYPLHLNPRVRAIARKELGGLDRVLMTEPLDVTDFHNLLARCFLVLTDSGGVQEEAPALDRPVVVMRDATERPEGLAAGTLRLAGTGEDGVYETCRLLLTDPAVYGRMARAENPYGDGGASRRIVAALLRELS